MIFVQLRMQCSMAPPINVLSMKVFCVGINDYFSILTYFLQNFRGAMMMARKPVSSNRISLSPQTINVNCIDDWHQPKRAHH